MSGGLHHYRSKDAEIIITTLTLADTWYQILTAAQAKNIVAIKIKSRYTYRSGAPGPFDLGLSATPGDNYWSNSGAGIADEFGPVNGLWARSAVAGTVIEVMVYK